MWSRTTAFLVAFVTFTSTEMLLAQPVPILRDVKAVRVDPTVVPKKDKVKEDFAPNFVQSQLINSLRNSDFQVNNEASVRAHIILEEFSSGSTAKRFLVGFGAGRSTVTGRLVFQDAEGKELANIPLKVRGQFMFSSYQGANTQRQQATSSFELRLMEEIARLK